MSSTSPVGLSVPYRTPDTPLPQITAVSVMTAGTASRLHPGAPATAPRSRAGRPCWGLRPGPWPAGRRGREPTIGWPGWPERQSLAPTTSHQHGHDGAERCMLRVFAGGQVRRGVVQHDRDAGGGRVQRADLPQERQQLAAARDLWHPLPSSSLIGRMSTRAAISPDEVNHDSLGHQRLIMRPGQTLPPRH
jgi:hypothetical protein